MINPRAIAAALTIAVALLAAPTADAIERHATPSNLTTVFSNARANDTILLASGNYGTFRGGIKSGMVTLAPEPRADVTMELDFNPAANITITRVTITGGVITGSSTHDITIRSSNVPGQIWLDTRELQNSDVILANDDFHDWDTCSSCGEARVFLTGGSQPSGVVIRESRFYGGLSDGIQNGSYGTKIIGNEFYGITPGSPSGVHADAIQLYGSSHTVIRGNYMHDMPEVPFIMAADGTDHELIEDNVVEGSSHGYPLHHPVLRQLLDRPPQHLRRRRLRLQHPLRGPAPGQQGQPTTRATGRSSRTTSSARSHRGLDHGGRALAQPARQRQPLGPGRDPGQANLRRGRESTEPAGLPAHGWLPRHAQGERRPQHRGADLAVASEPVGPEQECGWRESNPHVLADTAT